MKPSIPHQSRPPKGIRAFSLQRWLIVIAGGIGLLFLTLPIVALGVRALQTQAWLELPNTGVSEAIFLSFVTTGVSLILTAVFGTPLAFGFARWRFPFKRLLNLIIELPIVLPPAVAGLALLVAFGRRGLFGPALTTIGISLPFTTTAVIIAQTFVSAPFFIRSAQLGFQSVPSDIEDAARVDGASSSQVFRHITLPLASRALISGLIVSWARALGEFGATILFAGSLQGTTQTMPLLIYNVLERNLNAAIWTGILLIALAFAALFLSQWIARKPLEQGSAEF